MKKFFCLFSFVTSISFGQTILFKETFEDDKLTSRGWYDNNNMKVTIAEHVPGSMSALEFRFLQGARTPTSGGGIRRKFPPGETVYLSYWVKYSANYTGSNKPYHPHEFLFITNIDGDYIGPAATHLTTYIEQNEGTPMMSIQDALNIDEARIGQDLTNITEQRAVAGCNGSSDKYGAGECYLSGTKHLNGKSWKASRIYFTDATGKYYKNDWHFIEAYFKLNSIVSGKGTADGVIQYWFDGELIIDAREAMLRTVQYSAMKFNQFLIAPYIGDGSPIEQVMWIDDLTVATGRPTQTSVSPTHEQTPQSLYLNQNYPNPFAQSTAIGYWLLAVSHVQLEVFDLLGRQVTTVVDEWHNAGEHKVLFSARDGNRTLQPGLYIYQLRVNGSQAARKMMVIE